MRAVLVVCRCWLAAGAVLFGVGADTRDARAQDAKPSAPVAEGPAARDAQADDPAIAEPAGVRRCRRLESERQALLVKGIKTDMARGPEWARKNLSAQRITEILRFITVDQDLRFRCPDLIAAHMTVALEQRAKKAAEAAKAWAERQAQLASDPPLPPERPAELPRTKPDLAAVAAARPKPKPAAVQADPAGSDVAGADEEPDGDEEEPVKAEHEPKKPKRPARAAPAETP
ncbi:MAG: hypothetical protein NW205_04415 [Hyphomicrobiaceae bacterium]|nr:hypothetical protein [Hyphomicrobiaceae bacterium]